MSAAIIVAFGYGLAVGLLVGVVLYAMGVHDGRTSALEEVRDD